MRERLNIVKGDITTLEVDAIVNAANNSLLGGGGVDGAIHKCAGNQLIALTKTLGGCKTGDAKITPGFQLPVKYIIHTVGPIYKDGEQSEASLLESSYKTSLCLAKENKVKTIAFPAISCGVYDYPIEEAAHIALSTCLNWLQNNDLPQVISLVLFSDSDYHQYKHVYNQLIQNN